MQFPFTISSDIDLGARVAAAMVERDPDVTIRAGDVPSSLEKVEEEGVSYQLKRGEFLLNVPDGSRLFVKDGRTITYSRGPETGDRDLTLFILGSAWGALCYQRGLIPIHASANISDGRIMAFTGQSGAGKSTLAANLARRGYPFFTDDTLIFDPAAAGSQAICFAGQKQLKLWGDALEVTGAEALHPVREHAAIDKHFAVPPAPSELAVAPLAKLFVLGRARGDAKEANQLKRCNGSSALQVIRRNLYRPHYAEPLMGRKPLFLALKRLFETVEVYEFTRLLGEDNYEAALDFLENEFRAPSQPAEQ